MEGYSMNEQQNDSQLLLIDLSGIAHQIWHVSGDEPDPSYVSTQIIARVRALASEHPYAAVCCDSGKSFRAEIDPTYKAQRDTENRAPLKHQMDVACETFRADGFPVWAVKGFEADDLIATACREALAIDGTSVLIASADKDLLQLVSDRVTVKKITGNGELFGPAETFDKFGVKPEQMGDYLALVGDKSDNIIGAKGIGGVIAARLLSAHGTLAALYAAIDVGVVAGVTPAMRTTLVEFRGRWPLVAKLIALRTDAPIPFAEIAAERVAAPMVEEEAMSDIVDHEGTVIAHQPEPLPTSQEMWDRTKKPLGEDGPELSGSAAADALGAAAAKVAERINSSSKDARTAVGAAPHLPQTDVAASVPNAGGSGQPVPVDFSQQLEPRSMSEAVQLAQRMFESRLFGAFGTPQAVLSIVLAGRELGLPAMASLRGFYNLDGKPTLSSGLIQALVLKSGKAKYFRCSERTAERATFVTKRGDDPEMTLSFTVEEAKAAWSKDEKAWKASGWGRNSADMCVARAGAKLARLVFPDVCAGLYDPSEME
jgi:5'-3' exonuclease